MNACQTRLSLVMGVVAALGTALIIWAWWDSTEHFFRWISRECMITLAASKIELLPGDYTVYAWSRLGFSRGSWFNHRPSLAGLFPYIEIEPDFIQLPIWFLLCVFLSVMLLLWLFLMKRLARPRITGGSKHGVGS